MSDEYVLCLAGVQWRGWEGFDYDGPATCIEFGRVNAQQGTIDVIDDYEASAFSDDEALADAIIAASDERGGLPIVLNWVANEPIERERIRPCLQALAERFDSCEQCCGIIGREVWRFDGQMFCSQDCMEHDIRATRGEEDDDENDDNEEELEDE